MARLLTSLGVPCGHECVFNRFGMDNVVMLLEDPSKIRTSLVSGEGWLSHEDVVADSSYMAAPYLSSPLLADTKIIHAVRHPLKVISSFVKDLNYFLGTQLKTSYETFIYGKIPELYQEMRPVERACIFYVKWNEMIETLSRDAAYFRFRIEDKTDELIKFLNVETCDGVFRDRKANTMQTGKRPFLLKDLPDGVIKDEFVAMGERYGYDMDLKLKLF